MNNNNYLDSFLDVKDHVESEQKKLPAWVSATNNSLKAYEAINSLVLEKRRFIRGHQNRSHFKKKGSYLISKAEVAALVGSRPQPLFHSADYSSSLTKYFDDENGKLEDAKEKRLSKSKGGLRAKQKDELVKDLQEAKTQNQGILAQTVDQVFEKTLNKMPLDVKRKLGLI